MKRNGVIGIILTGLLLCSCQALEKKHQVGAAVDVNGRYLYRATLDSLTLGLNSEDSLRVTQQYISQWAKDELMYENALDHQSAAVKKEIDRMVEDYRRALYVQSYERYLVERRMPKGVADSVITNVYEQMPDRFTMDESIVKGLLVIVPKGAQNLQKLRTWLSEVRNENRADRQGEKLDRIEKFAYQNASGYELFEDRWQTTTQLLGQIPIERAELENQLKTKNLIEVSDTLKTYILQVTDKCLRGERMPVEYARPQIEKIVLNERQVDFLQKEREKMYNEAIQNGTILFYE